MVASQDPFPKEFMEITSTLDVISINKLRLNLTFNDLNLAAWPLSSLSRTYFKAKFQLCSQLPQDSNLEWTKSSHATFGGVRDYPSLLCMPQSPSFKSHWPNSLKRKLPKIWPSSWPTRLCGKITI